MNAAELAANPRLSRRFVQNLKRIRACRSTMTVSTPRCFASRYSTCNTRSRCCARSRGCCAPAAPLVISFSNRCFWTKAVAIWRGARRCGPCKACRAVPAPRRVRAHRDASACGMDRGRTRSADRGRRPCWVNATRHGLTGERRRGRVLCSRFCFRRAISGLILGTRGGGRVPGEKENGVMMSKRQAEFRTDSRPVFRLGTAACCTSSLSTRSASRRWLTLSRHTHDPSWAEWLVVPGGFSRLQPVRVVDTPIVVHRPVAGFMGIYRRHTLAHHQFFTDLRADDRYAS